MTTQRACKACDGTGYEHKPDFFSDDPHTDHAPTCWCSATECECCLGTGRVVDAITAQDAECDAETLRGVLIALWRPDPDTICDHAEACLAHQVRTTLVCMDNAGSSGIGGLAFPDSPLTTNAARAAFRAVPALREE